MKTIQFYLFVTVLVYLNCFSSLSAQNKRDWDYLQKETVDEYRVQYLDSIVDNAFISGLEMLPWNAVKMEDFSKKSKIKICEYFNRSIRKSDISRIEERSWSWTNNDTLYIKKQAERKKISIDSCKTLLFNERVMLSLETESKKLRGNIPVIFPYVLGWLDYTSSYDLLTSIIVDSLSDNSYASQNRTIFEKTCKLALARMGNKKYENEFIELFKNTNIKDGHSKYWDALQNLLYIGSKECTALIISHINDESYLVETFPGIPGENILYTKNIILISLYFIISDYPLIFEYEYDEEILLSDPSSAVFNFSNVEYYTNQFIKLENWLQKNSNYKIDRNTFLQIKTY